MIFAIIIISLLVLYLGLFKVARSDLPSDLYSHSHKINLLYKAHFKPLVEEYCQLKGYSRFIQYEDSVSFYHTNVPQSNPGIYLETVEYVELEQKLEQLKADMKRGCEVYCKDK